MMGRRIARLRSLWRGVQRSAEVDAEMNEEFRLHCELRAEDLMRSGVAPVEALRRARLEFGSPERYREEGREARGLERIDALRFSWLDFKLGFRMLKKYPGLTIIGGIAIAFAMALGAVSFEFMLQASRPSIPLSDGERIMAIRLWDTRQGAPAQAALSDFISWRDELTSIADIGAYRDFERNLIGADGVGSPVRVAEITAAGFRVARVAPLLGRPLLENDEDMAAPAVIIISESLWRSRFDADPAVIGRAVRLGSERHTVVGVMPEEFAFPLHQNVWIPLRLKATGYQPGEGGGVAVIGRLAEGATIERAQLELSTLGARPALDSRQSRSQLRPEVMPFARAVLEAIDAGALAASFIINGFMLVFMLLLFANVALLLFARAATRESELVVRNALGASRGRILTQLFTEALVLGFVGATVGLLFARLGVSWGFWMMAENGVDLPFWFHASLSASTIIYALGLTVLAAVVAGVIPGLKATRGIGTQLRAVGAGGGGLRFGGLWTVVIVMQVAFTVAFFPVLISVGIRTAQARAVELGVPAEEYLMVRLHQDATTTIAGSAARPLSATLEELKRRVSAEPGVTGATFAMQFPGGYHPERGLEVEGVPALLPSGVRRSAQAAQVAPDFFDVMGVSVQSGRSFHSADLTSAAKVVIVNRSFSHLLLGDQNPVGKRLRYYERRVGVDGRVTEELGPWHEIVGEVEDLAMWVDPAKVGSAGIYHPLSLDGASSIRMAVHVGGNPEQFAPRLRTLATVVDPALRLTDVEPFHSYARSYITAITFWFRIMVFAGGLALLLSLAGVYSVMAFTVSRRTREIGIRVALGAGRTRIIAALFSRTLFKIGSGVVLGAGMWALITARDPHTSELTDFAHGFASLGVYAAVMMVVCMLSCIVPARRALRVQPTEALRADG